MDFSEFKKELKKRYRAVKYPHEGMIMVEGDLEANDDLFYFIDAKTRKLVSDVGYEFACDFRNGRSSVAIDGKFCHIRKDGKPAYPQRYEDITCFDEEGFALVCRNSAPSTCRTQEIDDMIAIHGIDPESFEEDDYCDADGIVRSLWAKIDRHGNVVSEWKGRSAYF